MPYIAHTINTLGKRQDLLEHLRNVADSAANFAIPFGAPHLARLAGLLHDIGKFNPAFQQYLLDAEAGIATRGSGPDHKGAGAVFATQVRLPLLTFLVAGHHGGLPTRSELVNAWLPDRQADAAVQQAILLARQEVPELRQIAFAQVTPAWVTEMKDPYAIELFIRLLFSALVDADFLDTEAHFNAGNPPDRGGYPSLADLWQWFQADQQRLSGQQTNELNIIRHEVYEHCIRAAQLPPGFFRLTVPTGGGKTRSSLAFALAHAQHYGMTRVIYGIPFMSITEQTADVFRAIFQADSRAVLEHHSGTTTKDPDNPTQEEIWARLSAENWDAPLIVTTTVQLFESLLARDTRHCRKLHAIAGSVIILDEAQTLPPHVLTTILDVLRQLVEHYHVTVVLCTATQPALDDQPDFKGLPNVREIVPDPARLFTILKRVEYHWPQQGETWTWTQVAKRMKAESQALAIVNTRANAAQLLDALEDDDAFHLSTWMCAAHRRNVLVKARQRLQEGASCRLVSTQLIEAGVDIDFPSVLRAMGPLDSIVQAAGRCNREGRRPTLGQVIVFTPEEGGLPPGAYRIGTQLARTLTQTGRADLADPCLYQEYFERYYRQLDRDECQVQPARKIFDYKEVAERFQMIVDDTSSVIVRYDEDVVDDLVSQLRRYPAQARMILRRLQPFMVNLREREILQSQRHGLAEELAEIPGVWIWKGVYHPVRGVVLGGAIDPGNLFW
jgi:CRISPR-associated endonuclease/helicase Cas3